MAGDGTTRPSAAARQSAGSRRTSGPVADAVKSTRMTRSRLSTAWVQRPSAPAFALPGGAPTPGYRKPMSVPTRDLTKSCHFGSPTRCGRSVSICINAMMNTITARQKLGVDCRVEYAGLLCTHNLAANLLDVGIQGLSQQLADFRVLGRSRMNLDSELTKQFPCARRVHRRNGRQQSRAGRACCHGYPASEQQPPATFGNGAAGS